MSLYEEIEEAQDLETIDLLVPMLKSKSHPEGVTIQFRGLTFDALAELQGTLDLAAIQDQTADLSQMIDLVALTAYDPETNEKLFDSDFGKAMLARKGYKTVLFLLTDGATKVLGVDSEETAGKDSTSTLTDAQAFVGD